MLSPRPTSWVAGASSLPTKISRSSSSSSTLRQDGYAVCHAYDGLSATELAFALDKVHLVITNTRVSGLAGIELIYVLRSRLPKLPILYIANIDRSTPEIEAKLPRDVPILREPFTQEQLRTLVADLLAGEPWEVDLRR